MDTKTRAEKIEHYAQTHLIGDGKFVNFINSQLNEAVLEAHDSSSGECHICHAAWVVGFAAAREQAAGIANDHGSCQDGCHCDGDIAERIRAMEADK